MSAAYLRRHRIAVPAQLRSYTPDEAAAATGLTLHELRRMRDRGEGPAYVTIGKRTVRYIRSDVDEWCFSRSRRRKQPDTTGDQDQRPAAAAAGDDHKALGSAFGRGDRSA
ncbi:hypothetical protein LLS1_38420 [Leifsonia sp. LS1]|uniref:helix-turn-helix transcriptional regulator n=1 Tax=Leifsonia sp. LS1 TaxID=2828483 RepID=UPI001CFF13DF|nr:helix-turn-helix domain-containing protein [Leifsonia sp. LS1]GIT82173.1 hypothetical protein LLS1_38420 [Leifsonia sp. LS1]